MYFQLYSLSVRLRRGGVTPLTVLSLALLLGVVAVAVDGGSLMEQRRHVQATADAAALAAADDLFVNYAGNQGTDPSGTAQTSALAIAQANGFSNDGVQSIVTVNVSPQKYQGGPNAGQSLPAGYVEVIVQYNAERTFSNVFGAGTVPVRARAVARGQWTPTNKNVIALNLGAPSAVSVAGSGGGLLGLGGLLGGGCCLNVKGVVQINSNSKTALSLTGGGTLVALAIDLVQGLVGILGSLLGLLGLGGSPPAINAVPPTADPLRYLPDPDPVKLGLTLQVNGQVNTGGTVHLRPGVYSGGIQVSGGSTVVLHANLDGTPGIYVLQGGGFAVSDTSNVQMAVGETAGIMLYNGWSQSSDTVNLQTSGKMILTPPSSGPYKGLCIFQKRGTYSSAAPLLTITAKGTANIGGTLYAVYAKVSLSSGNNNNVLGGQIISDTLGVSGSNTVNIDPGTQPIAHTRILGLVE